MIFALETITYDDNADYWSLTSLAEIRVLTAVSIQEVTRAYRKAITSSRRNIFFLTSSLSQLEILQALEMRSEFVQAGIDTLQEEINHLQQESYQEDIHRKGKIASEPLTKKSRKTNIKATKTPDNKKNDLGQSFLFTGYIVDNPTKKQLNFNPNNESEIREAIRKRLEKYNAGPRDIAFTAGLSAGSEIIFAEICAEKGISVEAHLPITEAAYIREFIAPAGEKWIDRFYKIRNHPLIFEVYQDDRIGKPKEGDDQFERNNRWALYSSLVRGIDKVHLIALWDGRGGTPRDRDAYLVKHMVDLMRETGGMIEHINSGKFLHAFLNEALNNLPELKKPLIVSKSKQNGKKRSTNKQNKNINTKKIKG